MAKLSNMVWRRVEAVEHLRSALTVHGSAVVEGFEARMAAVLEDGEPMPGVGHLMDVLSRLLEKECRTIRDGDGERCDEAHAFQLLRRERRQVAAELRARLISLRDRLRGIYGAAEAARILGLEGRTPRGFEQLGRYCRWLVARLREVELPPPEAGLEVDPTAWANDLEPLALRLMALVDRLRLGGWRKQDAVHARNLSLASFDVDYVPVLRLIESVYLLGGQPHLARKLRPARDRRLVNRHTAFEPEPKAASLVSGLGPRLPRFLRRIAGWLASFHR